MRKTSYRRKTVPSLGIPEKANKILNLILVGFIIIILRLWYLAVFQYENKLEEARKPQRRTIIEASKRATIRDRFNTPLAINKISYQAAILYSQLRQIPSVRWEKGAMGKRIKKLKRKEYIAQLAQLLGEELNLDALRLEDLIHSKGSFYGQIPFVIKEDLTEQEYYRLKMLEKDWLGIHVQKVPKRYYPKGRVASDIIGYMGAINRSEYDRIMLEIKKLEAYIHNEEEEEELPKGISNITEANERLHALIDQAYTINDYVGKAGVEGSFENILRGYHGKKSYYSDARGNFLRELPDSREPIAGQRILLTISAELQEYAEKLLAQNERIRETRLSKFPNTPTKQPWIKGGAIIAMEPNTGEVLALASYPRMDPNDFIRSSNPETNKKKIENIIRWFESETYVASIWDQKRQLERERYDDEKEEYFDETVGVDWNHYLTMILKESSPILQMIQKVQNVENAVNIQRAVQHLLTLTETDNVSWLLRCLYGDDGSSLGGKIPADKKALIEARLKSDAFTLSKEKQLLDNYFLLLENHYDKILLMDLCRLAACHERFSNALLLAVGKTSLNDYRNDSAAYVILQEASQKMARELFHETDFAEWRAQHEKTFLKEKRTEEKVNHQYPKPYLDYLDRQEQLMFSAFWGTYRWELLLTLLTGQSHEGIPETYKDYFLLWHQELEQGAHAALPWKNAYVKLQASLQKMNVETAKNYLSTLRGFRELTRPLCGHYRHLRSENGKQLEKHLAAAFYPLRGYGYGRSQAYRQAATQGSIFKLVTTYEALKQRYNHIGSQAVSYKTLNPLVIVDQIFKKGKEIYVGYHQDGRPLPLYYNGGRMLKSHTSHIGEIDLLKALETSSNPYFSLLAAEFLESPDDLAKAASHFSYGQRTGIALSGEITGKVPQDLLTNRTGLYAMANGQHTLVVTPLQTAVMLSAIANGGFVLKPNIVSLTAGRDYSLSEQSAWEVDEKGFVKKMPPQVQRQIFMPEIIRNILLVGMRKVVLKQLSDGLSSLSHFYREYPEAIADYLDLKEEMVGKTSTAEAMENIDLDYEEGTNLYTHVWFGGVSFKEEIPSQTETLLTRDCWGQPELVVVVYLKYGSWGKESAPVAAQIVQKWREIKAHKAKTL